MVWHCDSGNRISRELTFEEESEEEDDEEISFFEPHDPHSAIPGTNACGRFRSVWANEIMSPSVQGIPPPSPKPVPVTIQNWYGTVIAVHRISSELPAFQHQPGLSQEFRAITGLTRVAGSHNVEFEVLVRLNNLISSLPLSVLETLRLSESREEAMNEAIHLADQRHNIASPVVGGSYRDAILTCIISNEKINLNAPDACSRLFTVLAALSAHERRH